MEKRINLSVNATGRLRRCGTMSIDGVEETRMEKEQGLKIN